MWKRVDEDITLQLKVATWWQCEDNVMARGDDTWGALQLEVKHGFLSGVPGSTSPRKLETDLAECIAGFWDVSNHRLQTVCGVHQRRRKQGRKVSKWQQFTGW